MFKVLGSISANLILAPIYRSGMLVAVQVNTGQITSSFFLHQLINMPDVEHQYQSLQQYKTYYL